jgi:hypothetical protein
LRNGAGGHAQEIEASPPKGSSQVHVVHESGGATQLWKFRSPPSSSPSSITSKVHWVALTVESGLQLQSGTSLLKGQVQDRSVSERQVGGGPVVVLVGVLVLATGREVLLVEESGVELLVVEFDTIGVEVLLVGKSGVELLFVEFDGIGVRVLLLNVGAEVLFVEFERTGGKVEFEMIGDVPFVETERIGAEVPFVEFGEIDGEVMFVGGDGRVLLEVLLEVLLVTLPEVGTTVPFAEFTAG